MANRPLWTVQELVAATGGALRGEVRGPINGVSIDSRAVNLGDVFVAIKGDKMDGHDFVVGALKAGAGVAVVSRPTDEMRAAGAILQVVGDPLTDHCDNRQRWQNLYEGDAENGPFDIGANSCFGGFIQQSLGCAAYIIAIATRCGLWCF
jgi:hypothetical protein